MLRKMTQNEHTKNRSMPNGMHIGVVTILTETCCVTFFTIFLLSTFWPEKKYNADEFPVHRIVLEISVHEHHKLDEKKKHLSYLKIKLKASATKQVKMCLGIMLLYENEVQIWCDDPHKRFYVIQIERITICKNSIQIDWYRYVRSQNWLKRRRIHCDIEFQWANLINLCAIGCHLKLIEWMTKKEGINKQTESAQRFAIHCYECLVAICVIIYVF